MKAVDFIRKCNANPQKNKFVYFVTSSHSIFAVIFETGVNSKRFPPYLFASGASWARISVIRVVH